MLETIFDIGEILLIGFLILTAYKRSSKLMKEIDIKSDSIPNLKKDFLIARQKFLNAVDELDTKLKQENKSIELKDFMDTPTAKATEEAMIQYKETLIAQAKDYKKLILPLIPMASVLLILLGLMLSRYQLSDYKFWIPLWLAILMPIAYLALSIRNVPKAHIGGKYFLENYYTQVGPGITIVWLWLESLVTLPTKTIYFNPDTDKITIAGEESQEISFDVAIGYRPKDMFSIVENIGSDINELIAFVNKLLITEIASVARYIITRKMITADEVLKMGPEIAGNVDDRIEVDYANFLGIDVDPSQIEINLSTPMIKARTDRSESAIKIVTAQNIRKQEFEKLMVNIDVLKQLKIDFGEDTRIVNLIAMLMLGKEGIAAFGGKLNFNMIQGMEDLMSGLKGFGGGKALTSDLAQDNVQKLLKKINEMNPDKLNELLKGVDMLTGGGAK